MQNKVNSSKSFINAIRAICISGQWNAVEKPAPVNVRPYLAATRSVIEDSCNSDIIALPAGVIVFSMGAVIIVDKAQ